MNLVDGKILDRASCDAVLESLNARVLKTLSKPRLNPEAVIAACDKLASALSRGDYRTDMQALGIPERLGEGYLAQVSALFSADALRFRMKKELGGGYSQIHTCEAQGGYTVQERLLPLGVLLHIAAGNADGLPAFSVLEGLLTGNINILKLPAAEGGLSVRLLSALIALEPALAEYIYVFDYSSRALPQLKQLIAAADGVVVWGGVEAVSALRALLPPNIRLIEWGHKVSFAYVTPAGIDDDALYGIAVNMAATGQLLCSACQGIYLDTEDFDAADALCRRFLPLLEKAVRAYAADMPAGVRAQAALQRRTAELETVFDGSRVFAGDHCSVTAYRDCLLQPAAGFANTWVRTLPRARLIETLRPYKNDLQTAALVCARSEQEGLADALLKSGVVRICAGARMSATYAGMPHDGEYPLRRYTKVASIETDETAPGR